MAEPVVLLHGFTGTPRVWDEVVAAIDGLDVRALALPGHRHGAAVRGPVTVEAMADAVESELAAAGIEGAHLVGNSLGGWVALELADRGRAASVLALAPAGFWSAEEFPRIRATFHRADRRARLVRPLMAALMALPAARRTAFRQVARHGDRLSREAAVEVLRGVQQCSAFPALLDGPAAAGTRRYDEVRCPVRALYCTHDRFFPPARCGPRFAERVPSAEVGVLEGVGHVPMLDDPALVAGAVEAWVRAPGSSARAAVAPGRSR